MRDERMELGDIGPAGGFVICADNSSFAKELHYTEAAPIDAGIVTWQEAEQLCKTFSHNGISGWRLPTAAELKAVGEYLRKARRKGLFPQEISRSQTFEVIWHWSNTQKGDFAVAVVTQENEDRYQPHLQYPMGGYSGGYYISEKGPWIGDEKEFPLGDCLAVRPVRDIKLEIKN